MRTHYQTGLDVLGFDWRDAFGVVHGVGKGVLSAFGAGSAGQALENVYEKQGWLPTKPGQPAPMPTVQQAAAAAQQYAQTSLVTQQAREVAAQEAARRRAEEERSRFWRTLIVGVTLAGVGIAAWRFLGPKHTNHPPVPVPVPAPAPLALGGSK